MTLRTISYAILAVMLSIAALVILSKLGVRFDPFNQAAKDKAALGVATEQVASTGEALKASDIYHEKTIIIQERAASAVQTIQANPDASTLLPDGLRADWANSIDGMRNKQLQSAPDVP